MDDSNAQEMIRRIMAARANAPLRVGAVHDVLPYAMEAYGGMPGVAVPLTWIDEHSNVSGVTLWIALPTVDELVKVLDKLTSPAFARAMAELGDRDWPHARYGRSRAASGKGNRPGGRGRRDGRRPR